MTRRKTWLGVILTIMSMNAVLGQNRLIGHLSSVDGGFQPGLILANLDASAEQFYVLLPFTKSGEALPQVEGSVAAGQTHYHDPIDIFGRDDVSHLMINGDSNLLVTTTYQGLANQSSPVHVPESSDHARSWRVYPGDWAATWDGLAIVNPGTETAEITVHEKSNTGQWLHSQAPIPLQGNAKYLTVLSGGLQNSTSSHFEIWATQPVSVTALRGSSDNRFLWANSPIAQPENPAVYTHSQYEVIRTEGISYGQGLTHANWNAENPSSMDLLLDIYEPQNAPGPRPVFVYIHGGGFFGGSRTGMISSAIMNYFASRGFVGISIDYRLARHKGTVPKTYFNYMTSMNVPTQTLDQALAIYPAGRDAKAAIRWLRAHAQRYQLDTDRITVAGGSAGAVTAIALGVSNGDDFQHEMDLDEDPSLASTHMTWDDSVHTIVDFWGSSAMVNLHSRAFGSTSRWDRSDRPLLIIHGTQDSTVLFGEALELEANYQQSGAPYELFPLEGAGHGPWGATVEGKSLYQLAFEFVVKQQGLRIIP